MYQSVFHHYNKCTATWFYGLSALNMNRVIACLWIIRDSHCILVFCQHVGNYSDSNNSDIKIMKSPHISFICRQSNVSHPIFSMRTTHNVDHTAIVNVEQQYKRSSFTLCLSGMFVILSCSFTSICFLTNNFYNLNLYQSCSQKVLNISLFLLTVIESSHFSVYIFFLRIVYNCII